MKFAFTVSSFQVTTYVGCKINALRRDESLDHKVSYMSANSQHILPV